MVEYDKDVGNGDDWLVTESLHRQIRRVIENTDCVNLISHEEYNRNFVNHPHKQESRSTIHHFHGVDDPNPEVPPAYTYAMINIDEKEEDGLWSFMFRIGLMDSEELIEKGESRFGERENHMGPPHIETEYDTKVLHYIFSGPMDRGEVIEKVRSGMEFFCEAVEYGRKNWDN